MLWDTTHLPLDCPSAWDMALGGCCSAAWRTAPFQKTKILGGQAKIVWTLGKPGVSGYSAVPVPFCAEEEQGMRLVAFPHACWASGWAAGFMAPLLHFISEGLQRFTEIAAI
jgi:hypothetical protein